MAEIQIRGMITKVETYVRGQPRRYQVFLAGDEKKGVPPRTVSLTAHTKEYFPIQYGDVITGVCKERGPSDLFLVDHPQVEINPNNESVRSLVSKALGLDYKLTNAMYNHLLSAAGSEDKIVEYVDSWCTRFYKNRSESILEEIMAIDKDIVKKFLDWWNTNYLVRRLLLLGVKEDEIAIYPYSTKEMFYDIMKNPYCVPQISMDKAYTIQTTILRRGPPTDFQIQCGNIVRWLWQRHFGYQNSGVEVKYLTKVYPINEALAAELTTNYRLYHDNGIIYFQYAYDAEMTVVNNVRRLIGSSFAHQPFYFRGNISEEQKEAIENVTTSAVSILTGGPGTGKCLAPETLIRMYNGDKKRADQMRVSDLLLGPDLLPRLVMGIGYGEDQMYRVASSISNRYFDCNSCHILTVLRSGKIVDLPLSLVISSDSMVFVDDAPEPMTITPLERGRYAGFELSGDGRFVLANGIITHNTTILKQIVYNYEEQRLPFVLVSFTGKAVSRVNDVLETNLATTIHRSLSLGRYSDCVITVIVEEASMLATELLAHLFEKYTVKQLILVGDVDQLAPISWGAPMVELIRSGRVPIFRLTANYRVSNGNDMNGILINSRNIINDSESFTWQITQNFNVIPGDLVQVKTIIDTLRNFNVPTRDFSVLTPYSKVFSEKIDDISLYVQQKYLQTNQFVIDERKAKWYIGDRVMITKNIPKLNLFNGMEGDVVAINYSNPMNAPVINDESFIVIDFGRTGRHNFLLKGKYRYQPLSGDNVEDLKEMTTRLLIHAYCLSVDKAQGSEKKIIVFYIPFEAKLSAHLCSNRIYTAITRAKDHIYLVGKVETLTACARQKPIRRNDYIATRLADLPLVSSESVSFDEIDYGTETYDADEFY